MYSVFRRTSAGEYILSRCKGMVPAALWGLSVRSTSPRWAFHLWHFHPQPGEELMALQLLATPLSNFTLSKALLCYIRLLVILVFREHNSNLMLKVLLFVYSYTYNSLGLSCTQILCWFSYVYSFPAVWCPKFYKPSISCYIFLYCNKIPVLQGNDKLAHTHLYANMIVFVLQNFNALAPN